MRKRALLSVSSKTGIEEFAKRLVRAGFEIISTGGTAEVLRKAKVAVTSVESVTEFPALFAGRVKTMHPKLLGGILFRRDDEKDQEEARTHGIEPIDLVTINLYPFSETVEKLERSEREKKDWLESAIEQIDIGGPALLRSAAKNFSFVTAVCDPSDYERIAEAFEGGGTTEEVRRSLAAKVFLHTAAYDSVIASVLSDGLHEGVMLTAGRSLRYGENPHQWGKFFEIHSGTNTSPFWKQLQGKELSYLNILDTDAAWRMVCEFSEPTAVFVKHANPSGIASHPTIEEAFQRAYDADKLSAFGVIIALNRPCTEEIARKILDQKIFTEVLVAEGFDEGALATLGTKTNLRIIEMTVETPRRGVSTHAPLVYRSAMGGMLVQNEDMKIVAEKDLRRVTTIQPTDAQIQDLLFAWKTVKHAKSNAIVFAKDQVTVGIGTGQTSRVDATWIAAKRAGAKAKGAVMASDAFFPFPDSIEEAAKHGIAAIIQPGGSIRDEEVFAKANELKIAMVLTGVRGFRH